MKSARRVAESTRTRKYQRNEVMEPALMYTIGTGLFVLGAAWGGTKVALNGTREKVREIHERLSLHISDEVSADIVTHERVTRIETKVDLILDRLT